MARTIMGVVSSDKADKTIVITTHTRRTHPLYKKQYTVTTKYIAHDEKNEAKQGDKVVIVETRPISRRKRFTLQSVLEAAKIAHVEPETAIRKTVKRTDELDEEVKVEAKVEKPAKVSKKAKEAK